MGAEVDKLVCIPDASVSSKKGAHVNNRFFEGRFLPSIDLGSLKG